MNDIYESLTELQDAIIAQKNLIDETLELCDKLLKSQEGWE